MPRYPFLSEDWMREAQRIRDEARGDGPAVAAVVRMNQVVTDVPFGDGTVEAHLDTSSGQIELGAGHLENADVTVALDYATAKAIFVEGTPEAGMQAFMAGKVRVQGDMAKLLAAMQHVAPPDPARVTTVQRRLREITE